MEKGVAFQHNIIDLKDKPSEFVSKYRQASGGHGSGLVPLLEHGDNLVIESDVVAKYVAQAIDGRDGMGENLYPEDGESSEHIDKFNLVWGEVTSEYYDVLRAHAQDEVNICREGFTKSLKKVDDLLKVYDGDFILGDHFSYAECLSAPWIQRAFVTLPYFRGIDLEEDILSEMEHVSNWMRAVCERPSCVETCCPESEMVAAAKRYYVSFISPGAKGYL